jgi:probable rRNA maturation factor
VIEIEALGMCALEERQLRRLCLLAAASAGVEDGHLAIEFVTAERIVRLNAEHRGEPTSTDVLSFPIDGAAPLAGGTRELGDVVICPEHTEDLREAVLHGVLHLVGMDHECDNGEMLAVQAELLRWESLPSAAEPGSGELHAPDRTRPAARMRRAGAAAAVAGDARAPAAREAGRS